jgi:large subunit ribosomal protein L10
MCKDFLLLSKGGEFPLAFSKEHKNKLLEQYGEWLKQSHAVFLMEYGHMTVPTVQELRAKAREAGGEVHVVKNTLMNLALKNAGYKLEADLEKTSIAGFAYADVPAFAKIFNEATKNSDVFSLKSSFLGKDTIKGSEVKALADLPPLPVMRATLLGLLQAPAGKLVRTLAEPARQLACVMKAYSEKESAPVAG